MMRLVHSISWEYHASLFAEAASGPERERSPWSRSRVPGNELRTQRTLAEIILGGGHAQMPFGTPRQKRVRSGLCQPRSWPDVCRTSRCPAASPDRQALDGRSLPTQQHLHSRRHLTQALAERGWKQGQNFLWDCVSAGGRLGDVGKLAAELVARQPELLVTQSSPAIRALIATKTTLPIVMSTPDPVGEGYAQSLARPGGNITGVADLSLDLAVKRIELVREFIPEWRNVAVLYRDGGDATSSNAWRIS